MKRIGLWLLLLLCVCAASAQTTQITASNIALFGGTKVTGSFCVTPTDQSGNPLNLVTSAGQQLAPSTSLCFPIVNGVLSSYAIVPDTALTQPVNPCYKLTIKSNSGVQIGTYPCIQPTSATPGTPGTPWSFDAYVPSTLPAIPALALPQYQVNGSPLANQAIINFVCTGCGNPSGGIVNIPVGSSSVGAPITVFSAIKLAPGKVILLVPNNPIILE
jgi:hypothetical protein